MSLYRVIRPGLTSTFDELSNCPDTLSGVASAMLSLPTLAQPPSNRPASPATQQTRHAMIPSEPAMMGGTVARQPGPNRGDRWRLVL
jgi:hypothetical protein